MPPCPCSAKPTIIATLPYLVDTPGTYVLCSALTWNQPGAAAIIVRSSDVTIDGDHKPISLVATTGAIGVLVDGSVAPLARVTVRNLTVLVPIGPSTNTDYGVIVRGATKVLLDNVSVENAMTGLRLENDDDVTVLRSFFKNNVGLRPVFPPTIGSSTQEPAGIDLGSFTGGVRNVVIEDTQLENTFADVNNFPLFMFGIVADFVDPANPNQNVVIHRCHLQDVVSGINIHQCNGLTIESVQFHCDAELAFFNAVQLGYTEPGFAVTNATLRGITLTHVPGADGLVPTEFDGLLFLNGSGGVLENTTIRSNSIADDGETDTAPIHLSFFGAPDGIQWTGLVIRNVIVGGPNTNGIAVTNGSSDVTITDSTVSEAVLAVLLQNAFNVTVVNSVLQGPPTGTPLPESQPAGVTMLSSSTNAVLDNVIRNFPMAGVILDGASNSNVVQRNTLIGNGAGPTQIIDGDTNLTEPNTAFAPDVGATTDTKAAVLTVRPHPGKSRTRINA